MRAYVTLLSSEKYLEGVIVLNKSLKNVGSRYPLYCVLSVSIDDIIRKHLEREGIPTIQLDKTAIQDGVDQGTGHFSHWSFTFDKLLIWGLTQFEKIVYLDSDMLILGNVDSLFEKQPFSAVAAGYQYCLKEDWLYLNSGLLVIEPDKEIENKMLELAPVVIKEFRAKGQMVGDQDVIKRYCEGWNKFPELHLDEGYNMFADYLYAYIKRLGYSFHKQKGKPIYVVHFIGKLKPWMKKSLRNWCWLIKTFIRNPYYYVAYRKYQSYLKE